MKLHPGKPPPSSAGRFSFGLFGPLEIRVDGRTVPLQGRKPRVLLVLLLLRAGEVVSRDTLIDELWGENPPKKAVGSLQNFVSDLRRALGKDVVVTQATGYSLAVDRECIDLHRFERLLEDARASQAAAERSKLLAAALALGRGPPLAEFCFSSFARAEISRIEELRTAAHEDLFDVELELGHHSAIIPQLEALVSENPLRERLRAQLMLALYRSGRQTEALAVYQDARRVLTEELGLEPAEELHRLEHAILVHDPALNAGLPEANRGAPQKPIVPTADPRPRGLRARWRQTAVLGALVFAVVAAIAIAVALGSDDGLSVVPNSVAIVDSRTNRLVGDVPVGRRPTAVAHGEGGVWVANGDDGTVSRIDPSSRRVVDVIRVGADVRDLATGFGAVWVAGGSTGTLARINPVSNAVVSTLRLNVPGEDGAGPVSFVAAGAGAVWATRGDNTLVRIDPVMNKVVARLQIPRPAGLAAGLGAAWLVSEDGLLLKVVPKKFGASIAMMVKLYYDALAPTVGAGSVWVIVQRGTGEIWRVDPNTGTVNLTPVAARYPLDLAVAERAEQAWAVDSSSALVPLNPETDVPVAKIRTVPTMHSALAVGDNAVWVTVQD